MMKAEQERLYQALPMRCLVRVSRTDDAMWVCDLPRRQTDIQAAEEALRRAGFACRLDENTRLWRIDWTESRLDELLEVFPNDCPRFPADERYHPAYALCRLWLTHEGERTEANRPLLRRVLKLTADREGALLSAVPEMYEQAALHLRTGVPSAHDAGRALAGWLNERSL